jgi:PKD repeat protein
VDRSIARYGQRSRVLTALLAAVLAGAVASVAVTASPWSRRAGAAMPIDPPSGAVTAVALPTVQTDGIVWSVAIVGNTVYAGGRFDHARPAGTSRGDPAEVVRHNILAFNLTTGELLPFAPDIEGQTYTSSTAPDKFCKTVATNTYDCDAVLRIKASVDGSRIFVAGDFATVDGKSHQRIAAFDTATGGLVDSFRPAFNGRIRGLAVTSDTVYVGGSFTSVNGATARGRLAAVSLNGELLPWAPSADKAVWSMSAAPNLNRIIVGGDFDTVNGLAVHGLMAVDATTGQNVSWATRAITASSVVTDIVNDGTAAYLSGYNYNGGAGAARFEGRMAVEMATGTVRWIDGCYGDTQAVTVLNGIVYSASHAHDCTQMNEFPQQTPTNYQRLIGETTTVGGTFQGSGTALVPNGAPLPAWVQFLPDLDGGPSTSAWKNGPWSLDSNGTYLVVGGEFLNVNKRPQQSLTRFAVPPTGPKTNRPQTFGTPTATVRSDGAVRVSFPSTYDRDSPTLRYDLVRSDRTSSPVASMTLTGAWWHLSPQTMVDRTLPAGQSVTYRVRASDPDGNAVSTLASTPVTGTATPALSRYATLVTGHAAATYWRLGDTSGSVLADTAAGDDVTRQSGVSLGTAGVIADEPDTAATFNGTSSGTASMTTSRYAPERFSIETWFKTSTTAGGQLIGWGTSQTGSSSASDRKLYLDNSGRIFFGVNPGARRAINSTATYRDGQWHHAAATLGPDGMALYVDGSQVAVDPAVTAAQYLTRGYWRLGGDTLSGWPSAPSSGYFSGSLDETATYRTVLTPAQVSAHYRARYLAVPVASFTASCAQRTCTFDASGSRSDNGSITGYGWDFGDGSTGTGVTTSHVYAADGTYSVRLTVTDSSNQTTSTTQQVSAVDTTPPGTIATDGFQRTVSGGWGSADVGGAWTVTSTASNYAVSGGSAAMTVPTAGSTRSATLGSVSAAAVDETVEASLSTLPAAGSTYLYLVARQSAANTDYRARVRIWADGSVRLAIVSRSGTSTDTMIGTEDVVGGLTLAPGTAIKARLRVVGGSPTTLQAKVWAATGTEPGTWQKSVTDSTAAQQGPGAIGLAVAVSSSNTAVPLTATFRNYSAVSPL